MPSANPLRRLRSNTFATYFAALQPKVDAVTRWIDEHVRTLLWVAAGWGALSFFVGLPQLYESIQLLGHARIYHVTISASYYLPCGYDWVTNERVCNSDAVQSQWNYYVVLKGWGGEFPADRFYKPGDNAILTYSKRWHYGVVTVSPAHNYLRLLTADSVALEAAGFPFVFIAALVVTNFLLIMTAALHHLFRTEVATLLKTACNAADQIQIIGSPLLQGALAGTLSIIPIATATAAFSVAARIDSATLSTAYVIYALLVIVLSSHVGYYVANGVLYLLRTKTAITLLALIGYGVALAAVARLVDRLVALTFSSRVLDLSSWWDVMKEFVRSLL